MNRKRKNDERSVNALLGRLYIGGLVVGALSLIALSIVTVWGSSLPAMLGLLSTDWRTYAATPSSSDRPSRAPITSVAPTPLPPVKPLDLPSTDGVVLGLKSGFLAMTSDGTFSPIAVQGTDAVLSPDGKLIIAYLRDDQLYLRQSDAEQHIETPDRPVWLAWNADGRALLFVVRTASGDSLFRLDFTADHATYTMRYLLTAAEIIAPPVANPATGRILIAEKDSGETNLYTIDSHCATPANCQQSSQRIALFAYDVNWLDYHPSATSFVFSTTSGQLFLFHTGSSRIEPIAVNPIFKRRPAFDPSGRYLTYLTQSNELYVLPLAAGEQPILWWRDVLSVDWANR